MAGILNNKERVMDFTITDEGKRQAGLGEMRFKFATFTDLHTFYDVSGSAELPELASDASERIFFETHNRYQDVIVPELEAGMSMRPFRTQDFEIAGANIASGSAFTGISTHPNLLTGSETTNNVQRFLNGITKNFSDQRILGSLDEFSLFEDLVLTPTTGSYKITPQTTFLRSDQKGEVFLEDVPSIFQDRRFSHFPNFLYLPPENLPLPGAQKGVPLGNYPSFAEKSIMTEDEINESLAGKDFTEVNFVETSRKNNVAIQFFESSKGNIEKLSIVDFGEFEDEDPLSPGRRIVYVGKIIRDSSGAETFSCIFTAVID